MNILLLRLVNSLYFNFMNDNNFSLLIIDLGNVKVRGEYQYLGVYLKGLVL